MRGLSFIATALALAAGLPAHAQGLRVQEKRSRLRLSDARTDVSLVIANTTALTLETRVEAEIVAPDDTIVSAGSSAHVVLAPGFNPVDVRLARALSTLGADDQQELLLYRLRYRIAVEAPPPGVAASVSGIVAVSEITADAFELLVGYGAASPGRSWRIVVRSAHPLSARPIAGVTVEATLDPDDEEHPKVIARGVTNRRGHAVLELAVPAKKESGRGRLELQVVGRRAGFESTVKTEVDVYRVLAVTVTTDRPLYQPGHLVHTRMLVLDVDGRPLARAPGTLRVTDEQGQLVFTAAATTSRFGVATADWSIPETAGLGLYGLEFQLDGLERDGHVLSYGRQHVKVSRYELPQFSVAATPDRPYYLAGEPASIDVRADYLFGKPVTRGRARVVLEARREWNYREQRWDIEEAAHREGELDAAGRFAARFDLADEHAERLTYRPFMDLSGTAYVTDATTGRTEERRFDVRITRAPIHVYFIERQSEAERNGRVARTSFYVSTFYADGTPASCVVEILQRPGGSDEDDGPGRLLRTVQTNRFGLAKVTGLSLAVPANEEDADRPRLVLTARDEAGRRGSTENGVGERRSVLLEARRFLLASGQAIELSLSSPATAGHDVVVSVVRPGSLGDVLASRIVTLRGGRASVRFPYDPAFEGRLGVVAQPVGDEERGYRAESASLSVFYPRDREVDVRIRTTRAAHRPGETLALGVDVRRRDGGPATSALGVLILDKALEDRAASERGVWASMGFLGPWRSPEGEGLAGVRFSDLLQLDRSQPAPEGLELLAEVLGYGHYYATDGARGASYDAETWAAFRGTFDAHLGPTLDALWERHPPSSGGPGRVAVVRETLRTAGVAFDRQRDAWGRSYRLRLFTRATETRLDIVSDGPDETSDTADDLVAATLSWTYFRPHGEEIADAAGRHYERTGEPIRDAETLRRALTAQGHADPTAWRDPWGRAHAVTFDVVTECARIVVTSAGPDGVWGPVGRQVDDVPVWSTCTRYFSKAHTALVRALQRHVAASGHFPQDEAELRQALAGSDAAFESLRDPWGAPYYAAFRLEGRYIRRATIFSYGEYDAERARLRRQLTAGSAQYDIVSIRSAGPDGRTGTPDDFAVGEIVQPAPDDAATPPGATRVFAAGTGGIYGVVKDLTEAVIAGATVTAIRLNGAVARAVLTGADGDFHFTGLDTDLYTVRVELSGFKTVTITDVPVSAAQYTTLDVSLPLGDLDETITVAANHDRVQTEAAMTGTLASRDTMPKGEPIATPRLRQYFPETLYWQPEVETDAQGHLRFEVPLADSITTWKVAVVASTEDGKVGIAEHEVVAFQPFFVDADPPPVLTQGDEIALPVVVRNYQASAQTVNVELAPTDWMTSLGPARRTLRAPVDDGARVDFRVRAAQWTRDGRVRVSARGRSSGDAVEKRTAIHPDGEEIHVTDGALLAREAALMLEVPEAALPDTVHAELKLAPDLGAHVLESVEAILQRPHGCAEQTISSTYPSLLALGLLPADDASALARRARRYLALGYQRLLGYQQPSGGFGYWSHGEPDLALTAYATRFLSDARARTGADESALNAARAFLVAQQKPDGSWPGPRWWTTVTEASTAQRTALIVLSLLRSGARTDAERRALERARAWLAPRVDAIDDPYLIATYVLVATEAGEIPAAAGAASRLRSLVRSDGAGAYWHIEGDTPFFGWGTAGRVETTALAVRALLRQGDPRDRPLIDRGLLFLLRHRDHYGIWWSTQATVNVLETLGALLSSRESRREGGPVEVWINGARAGTLEIPAGVGVVGPSTLDISRFVSTGQNHIEVRSARDEGYASVQATATYYVPWSAPRPAPSASLRLQVDFDRTMAAVGDALVANVATERVGSAGYGMMLAEIGLPPGADVDRESLDAAVSGSGWAVSQYDVLPDRVVVYLWPRAGGTTFSFRFRPRLAMNAQTAPSQLYDYYNPDARVVVAPSRFVVSEAPEAARTALSSKLSTR